jgi:hypothetical protein
MGTTEVSTINDILLEKLTVRALNVCLKAGLNSIAKLLEYYREHNTFRELKNCGLNTDQELISLCAKYGQEPIYEKTSLDEYFSLRLNYLKPYIPHAIFKELLIHGISTIGAFYDMNLPEFVAKHKLKPKFVERLRLIKSTMHSRPNRIVKIIKAHPNEVKLPIQGIKNNSVLPHDFLGAFEQILLSLLSILPDKRICDIIVKRFGLEGQEYTLEAIGLYYNMSREYPRLIEKKFIEQLQILLSGQNLAKPFCCCEEEYLSCISSGKEIAAPSIVGAMTDIIKKYEKQTGTPSDSRKVALLKILQYHIWGIKTTLLKGKYFCHSKKISESLFEMVAHQVLEKLSEKVLPCDLFELTVSVKHSLRNKNISNDFVQGVIEILPEVIKLKENIYEIEFTALNSLKDKAYRILFEKQDTMSSKDISREISHRLAIKCCTPKCNPNALVSQLCQDNRFATIGKSGVWGLTDWNLNTDTLIRLISTYLHTKNSPATLKEIIAYVKNVRPHADKQSIHGLLCLYPETISRTTDGRYILKDWESSYDTNYKGIRVRNISETELYEALKGIFEAHGFKSLSTNEILKALNANNIPWGISTCGVRINSCKYLIKSKIGFKNQYSFDRSFTIPSPIERKNKSDEIKKAVRDFLSVKNAPTPLSTVIHNLCKKGHNKGTLYRTISESTEFTKTSSDGFKIFLSINSSISPSVQSLSERVTSFEELIKGGESATVEFKSSLRWDLNRSILNSDLEFTVAKSIAGFLNTRSGTLFIGVNDSGIPVGLLSDYATFKKNNSDSFLLHLNNVITKYFSKAIFSFVLPTIEIFNGKEICIVTIGKSSEPVYLNNNGLKEFYIRASNATHKLDLPEVVSYVRANWGSIGKMS